MDSRGREKLEHGFSRAAILVEATHASPPGNHGLLVAAPCLLSVFLWLPSACQGWVFEIVDAQ